MVIITILAPRYGKCWNGVEIGFLVVAEDKLNGYPDG
jgi:hypothetical protein